MIEKTVRDFLVSEDNGYEAYVQLAPLQSHGDTYLVIQRTGTSLENLVKGARIVIQSYAPTMLEAGQLNDEIIDLMVYSFPGVTNVNSCRLENAYPQTDLRTKEIRYQAVFYVTYMEE